MRRSKTTDMADSSAKNCSSKDCSTKTPNKMSRSAKAKASAKNCGSKRCK